MTPTGTGKPEPLKHDLSGKWSRRITDEHRLIYKVENGTIYFYSAKIITKTIRNYSDSFLVMNMVLSQFLAKLYE